MGTINSFYYTEPAGGTKFRTYENSGFHTQVVILGDTDGVNLPLSSTYGLSVDIKRVVAGAAFSIADHTTTSSYASVGNSAPAFDAYGLTVRLADQQTVSVRSDDIKGALQGISDQLAQLIAGIAGWMGRDFSAPPVNRG